MGKKKKDNDAELIEREENKLKLVKGKQEIMAEYKANLPQYLEEQLEKIKTEVAQTHAMKGIPMIEINELIRAKTVYGTSPKYSAEELSIVFDYYRQALMEINKFTRYIPSKENFCAFAGMSTVTYNQYLMGNDEEKAEVMVQIDDYIKETMLTLAQLGQIKEVSTIFRGKASHGMVEASAPQLVVHKDVLDMSSIQKMIDSVKKGETLKKN